MLAGEMMHVRKVTTVDSESVRNVNLAAFQEDEAGTVSDLAVNLLSEKVSPEVICLVAEVAHTIVGYIAFSPVWLQVTDDWQGYILAPLGVKPQHQRSGVGSKLVRQGLKLLAELEVDAVFVYGDPKYYGKFGFDVEAATQFTTPYELEYPFGWQALIYRELAVQDQTLEITCVKSLYDPELW